MRWLLRQLNSHLAIRFIALSLVLLVLIQTVGFVAVEETLESYVEQEVQHSIRVSERIWDNLLVQNHERLEEGASLLAADFGFRSAVASRNAPTISSALHNSADRIGASVAVLVDAQWNLKASSMKGEADSHYLLTFIESLARQFKDHESADLMTLYRGHPTQFVIAPVRAPRIIGYVVMGFEIKQSQIDSAASLAGIDIALLARQEQTAVNILATKDTIKNYFQETSPNHYLTDSYDFDLNIGDEIYVTKVIEQTVIGGNIAIAFMKSVNEASTRIQELFSRYIVITLAGLLLFGVAITWLTRRVAYPLEALTKATRALEKGDYEIHVSGMKRPDEVGVLARSFDTMRASIKSQRETITRLAYYDPLTSLPNRFSFRQQVADAIQDKQAMHLSVITINLDRFKQVNDVLGYEIGDQILKTTALRLVSVPDIEPECVARVSGDEFTVLLFDSAQRAEEISVALMRSLNESLDIDSMHLDLSASIGIASWPDDAPNCDSLINASQIAMHAAKQRTQDIAVYRSEMLTATPDSLSLLSELRQAVKENELRVFLQPKVNAKTGQVIAAEALIRWQHPEKGMVPPFKFVPFAEQTGFIRELTRWIIREVADQWHSLQRPDIPLRVSINLSVRDLIDPQFPEFLVETLQKRDVPPSGICLEITESAIMDDPTLAEQTLDCLSERGFRLSIDDFGTGYSSLGYLKRLPVNELKVDQSFVFGMIENPNDFVIVQSTIDLAHNLGLSVVAEGVETGTMYEALCGLGCEEVQGYFIGKPMPIDAFIEWRIEWEGRRLNDS